VYEKNLNYAKFWANFDFVEREKEYKTHIEQVKDKNWILNNVCCPCHPYLQQWGIHQTQAEAKQLSSISFYKVKRKVRKRCYVLKK
jgi:hypothetical protein